jgi:hypothetical protein
LDDKAKQTAGGTSTLGGDCRGAGSDIARRVGELCDHDRQLMTEFGNACVRRLGKFVPLKLFLSRFQPVLDANVHKEIEKDRLIITEAAAGFGRGQDRAAVDVDGLFERTREIDAEFVRKLSTPLFSIDVRYEDFAEVRKGRILCLIDMVFDLMCNWRDALPFPENLKNTYAEKDYRELLGRLLHLYNIETRMLSNSFSFHGPAAMVKDLFAEKLFATMERTAGDICTEYTRKVYGDVDRPSAA